MEADLDRAKAHPAVDIQGQAGVEAAASDQLV